MVTSTPNIQIISSPPNLKLALLDLQDFASFTGIISKRDIEKEGALYVLRNMLKMPDVKIGYSENGKPFVENCPIPISISHSHDKLALLFSYNGADIGVDVEKVRDKVLKIKERFLSSKELKHLENSDIEVYILYWAIKEAVYKAAHIAGLSFVEQILVDPFTYSENGGEITALLRTEGKELKFNLHYFKISDYIVAYTNNA